MIQILRFLLLALLGVICHSYMFSPNTFQNRNHHRSIINHIKYSNPRSMSVMLTKKDLFSDDLFEEDDEVAPKNKEKDPSKQKFMNEKWSINSMEAKAFSTFPLKVEEVKEKGGPPPNVPVFVVMFKFRPEYREANFDATTDDHHTYCKKFERIISSEIINLKKGRGVVTIWSGKSEDSTEKAETRDDINSFIRADPYIMSNMVQTWDVIDLSDVDKAEDPKQLPVKTEEYDSW